MIGHEYPAFKNWAKETFGTNWPMFALYIEQALFASPAGDSIFWKLAEMTGDQEYTPETFEKAAKAVLLSDRGAQ